MEIATGVATAWLVKKAVQGLGLDLTKVADHVVDDVTDFFTPSLPANPKIGRNVNTKA